jgi:hypothetical protein
MFVKEFGQVSAKELNQQLNKVYHWQLNLSHINENDAAQILQTIGNKIRSIKTTGQAHFAERNPQYMEAVMVGKFLETWKNEMATHRTRLAEAMRKIDEYCSQSLNERESTPTELKKREHYAMALKGKKGDFEKRYGARGKDVMYATATKMAKNESYTLPPALTESEIEQARVTMAQRDLADSVQDLVSKISDMQNEKLPALVSAMKDEMSMDQATQFNSAASSALQTLLDAANSARDALDNASRGQLGSMGAPDAGAAAAPNPDMNAPVGGTSPEPESDFNTADSATGGPAEMGRGLR